ncbi:uncharacterized protein LOC117175502 [Belonocnema kinseyi]|uniref:uncharacterized protein LOC117175502 n=1 Tax=Belonocnema kinseyi TaxID=2817044 RepID=UPI00143D72B8|nr:uncharacterized protein LOC117175502 [Belonocnema kinseyi]
MVPDCRAAELVKSYPPTSENYEKAMDSLKKRFGRDDLQIEVYVRELFQLVLQNVMSSKEVHLASLYDKIKSYLRALDTLGVTTDKCAAMLFPLVESSLPEELLRVWQRSNSASETNTSSSSSDVSKTRLNKLISFLESEVQNELRISMAVQGFSFKEENESERTKKSKNQHAVRDVSSARDLLAAKDVPSVTRGSCLQELEKMNVALTDVCNEENTVAILIRADVAGKLLTGRLHVLESGLTAIETYLGWTLMDHTDHKKQRQHDIEVAEAFRESVVKNGEGRYEVKLPWLECHPEHKDNKTMAVQRLEPMVDWGNYLPHRPIFKEHLTTSTRPIFDASAGSSSLNRCLEKGPNLIEQVGDILLRFREGIIGVMADIKKAFLQISVDPTERDFLTFLWYVAEDNCVTSSNNVKNLYSFMHDAKTVMESGHFDLRGWEHTNDGNSPNLSGVIGLLWDKQQDPLSLNLSGLDKLEFEIVTKRNILSIAHRIFDPLGFVCPVSLGSKILLQEAWAANLTWDEEVSESIKKKFANWIEELKNLDKVLVPRCMIGIIDTDADVSIHTFVDASKLAYAAVIFIRIQRRLDIRVHFIQAKTRVAPAVKSNTNKSSSIPRLELLAATIGARLTNQVLKALDFKGAKTYYWNDSSTVVAWINRQDNYSIFVSNRVKEIRDISESKQWRHIPGHVNPADLPSRGCTVNQLLASRWWQGPDWLKESKNKWPTANEDSVDEAEVNSEVKKSVQVQSATLISVKNREIKENLEDEIIKDFLPFIDSDGLIRTKSKLLYRDDSFNLRCPVILPSKEYFVELLIREKHTELKHAGAAMTLNVLKEKFWIMRGRKVVREVIKKCVDCRRHDSKSVNAHTAPLPLDRVRDAAVFEVVGVDFADPISLKGGQKAWICIFTCAVYRAVHLELVNSLSVASFLMALRRHIARRGRPSVIFSDNGTNFVGLSNQLKVLDYKKITKTLAIQQIEWRFNPPSAPWWGGFWERLIGILKRLLRRTLKKSCLNYEEMLTTLTDCEAVINSRPITYLPDSHDEIVPLTPSMFLQEVKEIGVIDLDKLERIEMNKRFKYRHKIKQDLRQRFRNEYLGTLTHQKRKGQICKELKVGDVVLVGNDNAKRIDWPLAKVKELHIGKDGHIRVARLITTTGELTRPIQRFYSLELSADCESENALQSVTKKLRVAKPLIENGKPVIEQIDNDMARQAKEVKTRSGRISKIPKRLTYN